MTTAQAGVKECWAGLAKASTDSTRNRKIDKANSQAETAACLPSSCYHSD